MIDKLKPYPAYKDSGVPWLGEVPEHWEIRQLRHVSDMRVSNVDKHTEKYEHFVCLCNYTDVYKHERIDSGFSFMHATATREEIERFKIRKGDVLLTKDSETWDDIGVPAIVEEDFENLVCGYHLAILRPFTENLASEYLLRTLQSKPISYQFHVQAKGVTRFGLSHIAIKSLMLPLPSKEEQARAAKFLKHIDRRIRRYIAAKKKLIKLLEEYKQVLIHRAVTGQIDVRTGKPYPKYRDSGIEWLGDVPEHWMVMPIKRAFASMEYGISAPSTDTGSIRLITMGHIKNGEITVPESGGVDFVDSKLYLKEGDLIFNRTNSAELVGKVGLFRGAKSPTTFASYLVRMQPNRSSDPEYLNFLLNDIDLLSAVRREAIPSLHQSNLNATRYGRIQIILPGPKEQRRIALFLNDGITSLNRLTDSVRREMTLIRELHAKLIADVVTGKLDVREAAANLPEESEEIEDLEDTEIPLDEEESAEDIDLEAITEEVER